MSVLYLIPTPLGKEKANHVLPEYTIKTVNSLSSFVVENIRHAQSFLQWTNHPLPFHEIEFRVLNKKTPEQEVFGFLKLFDRGDTGLFSEAGSPAIADPGTQFIRMSHDAGHQVVPLSGPSSIFLALMASGLNGQNFAFHGYLPIEEQKKREKIRKMEEDAFQLNQTQIFMETPFRNDQMLQSLTDTCQSDTYLCVASDLTLPGEKIVSKPVYKWKESPVESFHGKPAIFLIYRK